ncbi:MauE/DoxX family redox-associated membrane protein [Micromonospora musae]|uniref:MauE/DoxX family redox-associated membrane protein n=1 Tax=Micromonospora musae TaxID=1894970 RepID=UPI00344660D8
MQAQINSWSPALLANQMKRGRMEYVGLASRALVVGIFIAAMAKARSRKDLLSFVDSIREFRLVPPALVWPTAILVIVGEVAVVFTLILPGFGVAGFVMAATMLAVFTVTALLTTLRGRRVPCRCFGRSVTPIGPTHVWRNATLLTVALIGAAVPSAGQFQVAGVIVSLIAASAGTIVMLFLADFVSLFSTQ